jgi:hypothetical protein
VNKEKIMYVYTFGDGWYPPDNTIEFLVSKRKWKKKELETLWNDGLGFDNEQFDEKIKKLIAEYGFELLKTTHHIQTPRKQYV